MTVFLAPVSTQQWFSNTGAPLAGGQLFFYAAGTVTPQNTYTDNTGATPNANPIILSASGFPPNEIWFTGGLKYKLIVEDALNNPVGITLDNLSGINDIGAPSATSEWLVAPTPTYVSSTSFTAVGDQRTTFTNGRRIQASVTAGTVYGEVVSTVFTSLTTVTVQMDPGQALDSGLSSINVGITSYFNTSVPLPNPAGGSLVSAATLNLELNADYANIITGTTTITAVILAQGKVRTLVAQSAGLTVQAGASLITPSGRNIIATAGDAFTFFASNGNIYATIQRQVLPNFYAYMSASQTITTTTTQLAIPNVTVNDGTGYSVSTNKFTPQVPGRYTILVMGQVSSPSASLNCQILVRKNGSLATGSQFPITTVSNTTIADAIISAFYIVDLNGSTDYIDLAADTGNGTCSLQAYFAGYKIDP